MKKEVAIIGLGKMGGGLAAQLLEKGWRVLGSDPSEEAVAALEAQGMESFSDASELLQQMEAPRVVWVMVPSGEIVEQVLVGEKGLATTIEAGDYVIDGGNSHYIETKKRAEQFEQSGVHFIDAGVSGGPGGARNGACIMVGGSEKDFAYTEDLFRDLSVEEGYAHFTGVGAGHYVKMVHNGIEYGMMQAIAEGFNIMKQTEEYNLNLTDVAHVYNHASVIESRLVQWLKDGFDEWGEDLDSISGSVHASGEGKWTVEAADMLGQPNTIIRESLDYRTITQKNPSYVGKLLSAMRGQFGGHPVFEEKED